MNKLTASLVIAFLFFAGSLIGYVMEFCFRNLISHNGPKGSFFINPGFCKGPYLPIYGFGLTTMFFISYFVKKDIGNAHPLIVIIIITLAMTLIEFIGGLFLLKVMDMRLWDYRKIPGNIMGIICPLFSLIWGIIGAVYYLFIHPLAVDWVLWLSQNLAFSFFIGLFYGVFIIDVVESSKIAKVIKKYGDEHEVIVKLEEIKSLVQQKRQQAQHKIKFFNQTVLEDMGLDALLTAYEELHEAKNALHNKKKQ